jgi:hypothetical protein
LGGGYNFEAENEDKVSKQLYLIRNNAKEILKIGKASSAVINELENIKVRSTIFPFVYGVPILCSNSELVVVNSNGCL